MSFALVCGASGNIGTAICRDLAKEGWSLYLHYYQNQDAVSGLIDELSQQYPKQDFLAVKANFRSMDAVEKITQQIFTLDAIVFAQGTTKYQLLSDFSAEQLDELWQEQLKIPILLIQKLVDKISQNPTGQIVFIGSIYGAIGSAMEVPYSMIKGAMSSFANAYAKEVATLGITVNVVAPGAVATKMNNQFDDQEIKTINQEIPVGRFAKANEISYIVQSLLNPQASYITGQTIYVDGGWKK